MPRSPCPPGDTQPRQRGLCGAGGENLWALGFLGWSPAYCQVPECRANISGIKRSAACPTGPGSGVLLSAKVALSLPKGFELWSGESQRRGCKGIGVAARGESGLLFWPQNQLPTWVLLRDAEVKSPTLSARKLLPGYKWSFFLCLLSSLVCWIFWGGTWECVFMNMLVRRFFDVDCFCFLAASSLSP